MKKVHFIAIGGSAMHNLAIALHLKGIKVSGSDDEIFEPSKGRLKKYNLLPSYSGWKPAAITPDLDAVILGMHAHADNPELKKTKDLGLKIFSYPEFLYEQSKDKKRVVIGGSHGKTTITAMILHVLHYHKKDVDYMVGAQLEGFDVMVKLTKNNEWIILEGDEYLSSSLDRRSKFLLYKPHLALISGIAWDHVNVFPTFDSYLQQFRSFVESFENEGTLVYNSVDVEVKKIAESYRNDITKLPYDLANHRIEKGITYLQTEMGEIPLEVFGDHNLSNMEGARLILNEMGLSNEDFYKAIQSFSGASKRLEKVFQQGEYTVFKDFAHAPSKVRSTSEAVKKQFPNKEVWAFLELHTYSSLQIDFLKEYRDALSSADHAVVYYSKETVTLKRLPPVSPENIKEGFARGDLMVVSERKELETLLKKTSKENAIFLMMSSGNWGSSSWEQILNPNS